MFKDLSAQEAQDIKNARVLYYDFFYGLFVFELLEDRAGLARAQLELLLHVAEAQEGILLLKEELERHGIQNLKEEFSRLFALPFGGKQVGMHLSHYYEHCIGGQSLLKMRTLLKKSDVRVQVCEFKESEEHLGFLFGFMRYLIESENRDLAREVFLFVKDAFLGLVCEIKARSDAKYYRTLAELLEEFIEFENHWYA